MYFINREELKKLIKEYEAPCVSIFMPTHTKGKEIGQDPIRLKNLLERAEKLLLEEGLRSSEVREFLRPAEELVEDEFFWRHQNLGLALFLTSREFYGYRLPLHFLEITVVSHRFHLKPLLPVLSGNRRFFLLAIDQRNIRLFHGSSYGLSEIELKNVPLSIEEALKYDDPERQIQYHTGTGESRGGRRAAIFHGQGVGTDARGTKKNILRFFQMVDKGVFTTIGQENAPLILSGIEFLHPIYKKANSYPHLLDEGIRVNPDDLTLEKLHEQAWSIVQPYHQKDLERALPRYRQLSQTEYTSHDLKEIVKASYHERIDVLFIVEEFQEWGKYSPETDEVIIHENMESGDDDLTNITAIQTYLHGGKIFTLKPENMPDENPVAAIFRYRE